MNNVFKQNNITCLISEKKDGSMRIGKGFEKNLINRDRFFEENKIKSNRVVSAELIHDSNVVVVDENDAGLIIENCDGLITNSRNIFLAVTVADCLPIILYDKKKKVISLLHAGWKSLSKNIIMKSVDILKKEFNSDPNDILAGVGPGICSFHFEVRSDLVEVFKNYPDNIYSQKNIDLKGIAKNQLEKLGIIPDNIQLTNDCTFCDEDRYFSFRRDNPKEVEAMVVILSLN